MKRPAISPLFLLLLLIGILSISILLFNRLMVETEDTSVAAGFSYGELAELSQQSGEELHLWLSSLQESGLTHILLTPEEAEDAAILQTLMETDLTPALLGTPEESSLQADLYVSEDTPYRNTGNGEAIALIENDTRTGVLLPNEDWDAADLRESGYQPVKVLKLYDDYRNRYTEDLAGREIEALLFRAVTDRSQRFLWLAPFTDEAGTVVTDLSVYTDVLHTLGERLVERGYTFGEGFSVRSVSPPNQLILTGSAITVAVLGVYLLMLLFPALTGLSAIILLACATLGCVMLSLLLPLALFQTLASLGAAVVVPSLSAVWLREQMKRCSTQTVYTEFPLFLMGFFALSAAGGLLVAALLSTEDYLLEFSIFSGVKVAELTPLLLCLAVLLLALRKRPSPYPRKNKSFATIVLLLLGCVLVGGILVLLYLRSGDGLVVISQWETDVRDFLERILYVRPRTKEFLGAWPALAVFLYFVRTERPLLSLPFGVLSCVGSVSVVNTFCHLYTPLAVSLLRGLLGLAFGLVLGGIALFVLTVADRHFAAK